MQRLWVRIRCPRDEYGARHRVPVIVTAVIAAAAIGWAVWTWGVWVLPWAMLAAAFVWTVINDG